MPDASSDTALTDRPQPALVDNIDNLRHEMRTFVDSIPPEHRSPSLPPTR